MKKYTFTLICAMMLLVCNTFAQYALTPATDQSAPDNSVPKGMENMMPGPVQKMMASRAGDWVADMVLYNPGMDPIKQTAKVHNEMYLDRYLISTYSTTMMDMPFLGMATLAYDNGTQKYYMTWIDNFSTGMTQLSGTYDEKTKTTTLLGISQDLQTGKEVKMRQTITYVDDEHMMMMMYEVKADGTEEKMLQITLTRV